ncbi:hypothetical protein LX36DRAFT_20446 [Colletotrichum falcatum]|nr:hypothetical protein LX36DRAFT_20446 [Colletotrichum falcatum]
MMAMVVAVVMVVVRYLLGDGILGGGGGGLWTRLEVELGGTGTGTGTGLRGRDADGTMEHTTLTLVDVRRGCRAEERRGAGGRHGVGVDGSNGSPKCLGYMPIILCLVVSR